MSQCHYSKSAGTSLSAKRVRALSCFPFPDHLDGINLLPVPITPQSVIDYWHKGKEIVRKEMPNFHLRPEWKSYRDNRTYQAGAKTGATQHAIFKDILAALKTIAGGNKRSPAQPAPGA